MTAAQSTIASLPAAAVQRVPAEPPIRVLILEDNTFDADLIIDTLEHSGLEFSFTRVDTQRAFAAALAARPDLILSDFHLGQFNGIDALKMVRESRLDTPFILVSGTIGEDIAVQAMREGADDYLLKDRLARLESAVRQALEKRRLREERRHAESARRESEERFRQIAENIREVFWLTGPAKDQILYVSPAYEQVWGRSRESLRESPQAWIEAIHPDDRSRVEQALNRLASGDYREEFRIVRPDGAIRWIKDRAFPVANAQGDVFRVAGMAEDITEQKEAEDKIRRLNRVHAVLSGINTLIVRVRSRAELFEGACRIAVDQGNFGLAWIGTYDSETHDITPAALAGMEKPGPFLAPSNTLGDAPRERGPIVHAIRQRKPVFDNDIRLRPHIAGPRRKAAMALGMRSVIALPLIIDDQAAGIVSLFAREAGFFNEEEVTLLAELAGDISFALRSIEKQEKLEYLSCYDVLTGLPNRALFLDRLRQQLHARNGDAAMVALALIDLDGFTTVNETLGHHGGDVLLRQVASRLQSAFSDNQSLARIGGDGFGIVLRGAADAVAVARLMETTVLECLQPAFLIEGGEVRVSATAGMALFPGDGADAEALFRNAEAALKKAKSSGDRYMFYTTEMNAQAGRQLALETRLRASVANETFQIEYQPKIDLLTGHVSGVEALMRWTDVENGPVPPSQFIPILERTGLIVPAGRWIIRQALLDSRQWHAQGLHAQHVAVNVSAIQLRRPDFVEMVAAAVQESGVEFSHLELEVTESLIMDDIADNIRKLRALREMGVSIAVDDFGTGYSSLGYLTKLPITSLKIDRSFIVTMVDNADSMTIVSTIISLAHSLNLKVVAEGVDSEEQRKFLRLLKCDEIQGYLISKPVPPSVLSGLLARKGNGRGPVEVLG